MTKPPQPLYRATSAIQPNTVVRGLVKPRRAGSLKEATARLFDECGGFTAAVRLPGVRIGRTTAFKYTDQDDPENRGYYIPADVTAVLERSSGVPHVSGWLARETGHVLVTLDAAGRGGEIAIDMARVSADAARLFADYAHALADDGAIDGGEAATLCRDTDKMIVNVMNLYSLLRQRVEGEGEG